MIVAVLFKDHDYEPRVVYLDSKKLDPDNPVDAAVLKALDNGDYHSNMYYHNHDPANHAFVDARGWGEKDSPFKGNEPCFTGAAEIIQDHVIPINRTIHLTIRHE
tara:strand:+ start:1083 stop:1397 length:315 start_codon:yes stop_codon:yes gene_type:complete